MAPPAGDLRVASDGDRSRPPAAERVGGSRHLRGDGLHRLEAVAETREQVVGVVSAGAAVVDSAVRMRAVGSWRARARRRRRGAPRATGARRARASSRERPRPRPSPTRRSMRSIRPATLDATLAPSVASRAATRAGSCGRPGTSRRYQPLDVRPDVVDRCRPDIGERGQRLADVVDDRLDARARLREVPVERCELVFLLLEARRRRLDGGCERVDCAATAPTRSSPDRSSAAARSPSAASDCVCSLDAARPDACRRPRRSHELADTSCSLPESLVAVAFSAPPRTRHGRRDRRPCPSRSRAARSRLRAASSSARSRATACAETAASEVVTASNRSDRSLAVARVSVSSCSSSAADADVRSCSDNAASARATRSATDASSAACSSRRAAGSGSSASARDSSATRPSTRGRVSESPLQCLQPGVALVTRSDVAATAALSCSSRSRARRCGRS